MVEQVIFVTELNVTYLDDRDIDDTFAIIAPSIDQYDHQSSAERESGNMFSIYTWKILHNFYLIGDFSDNERS